MVEKPLLSGKFPQMIAVGETLQAILNFLYGDHGVVFGLSGYDLDVRRGRDPLRGVVLQYPAFDQTIQKPFAAVIVVVPYAGFLETKINEDRHRTFEWLNLEAVQYQAGVLLEFVVSLLSLHP